VLLIFSYIICHVFPQVLALFKCSLYSNLFKRAFFLYSISISYFTRLCCASVCVRLAASLYSLLFIAYRPPLWSGGQNSWLQIQRFRLDSWRYQIFWEEVGLEWGPLSLMSTVEELFGRNSSGSSLEIWEYGFGDFLHWPRDTLYPQTLALTSLTSSGRSVGIVRSRTKATELI
jgi:hypothetical protein